MAETESKDPEINAIGEIVPRLAPFDFETRGRMLRYVTSWASDPKTQAPTTERTEEKE